MPRTVPARTRALLLPTAVLTCVTILLTGAPAAAAPAGDWSSIGHRGFPRSGHTEDTIGSFDAARRAGADAVELDLRLTSDLRVVVMHDPTLDRTTGCHGEVAARTLREIRDHCRGRVAGEPVPTAGRVLSWARAHRMNVIMELKYDRQGRWTQDRLASLDRLLLEHGMRRRVVLMSFNADYLATAEDVDPALETDRILTGRPGAGVLASGVDVVNVAASRLTAVRVAALHAAGIAVFGRKTNSRRAWRRLDRVGADGLLTDAVPAYVGWRHRHHLRR